MMYTKPFDDKDCCVELYDNSETLKFDVCGIDAFGEAFEYSYDILDEATSRFYFKLCYILNAEVMAKTSCQRRNTDMLYRESVEFQSYRQHLIFNLEIDK